MVADKGRSMVVGCGGGVGEGYDEEGSDRGSVADRVACMCAADRGDGARRRAVGAGRGSERVEVGGGSRTAGAGAGAGVGAGDLDGVAPTNSRVSYLRRMNLSSWCSRLPSSTVEGGLVQNVVSWRTASK